MDWMRLVTVIAVGFAAVFFARPPGIAMAAEDPDYLTVGAGYFDALSSHNNAMSYRFEYRSGYRIAPYVKPFVGVFGTSEEAVYIHLGLVADFPLRDVSPDIPNLRDFVITVIGGLGYYDDGNGKDLGNDLIFRIGAELAYEFENKARLGITFHHISNANIGERNPGAEMIGLFFSYSLKRLF